MAGVDILQIVLLGLMLRGVARLIDAGEKRAATLAPVQLRDRVPHLT
jgi:hypothetical protein